MMRKRLCALLLAALLALDGRLRGRGGGYPHREPGNGRRTVSITHPDTGTHPQPHSQPHTVPHAGATPPPTLLGETEDMGQEYLDSIVFYGDSNTNRFRLAEIFEGGYWTTQVWTPMTHADAQPLGRGQDSLPRDLDGDRQSRRPWR